MAKNMIKQNNFSFTDKVILVLLFASLVSFSARGFEEAQTNLFNIENITRIVSEPLLIFLILLSCMRRRLGSLSGMPKSIVWLVLYWLGGLFSLFYAQWLSYSIIKLLEYGMALLAAYYIANMNIFIDGFSKYAYKMLIYFFEILMLTVIIGLIISPSKALYSGLDDYNTIKEAFLPFRLSGFLIPISSTSVGFISAILIYVYTVDMVENKKNKYAKMKLILFLFLFIFAQSRTAIIGLVLALSIYFFFINKNTYTKTILVILIFIVVVFFGSTVISILLRGQTNDQLTSLSGRTIWWKYAINYFQDYGFLNKLIGGGFAGAEKIVAFQSNNAMYTLDSEFFAALISTGILGVFFLYSSILSIIYLLNKIIKQNKCEKFSKEDRIYSLEIIGIISIIIVRTTTVTTLAVYTYYLLAYLICIVLAQSLLKSKDIK